ncbi:MAG: response regulator [Bacteroidota bacterium]
MNQLRILVVDDDETLRSVLSNELKNEGYIVETAADGDEAIKIVKQRKFDLALLDIKLPRVDGFQVLQYLKKEHPVIKVIMLTGFADLKNAIEAKKLGADDFVSKPYDIVDLVTTIERAITSGRSSV